MTTPWTLPRTSPWLPVLGTLALTAAVGAVAVSSAPDAGHVTGVWPVGLATGALVLAHGRRTALLGAAVLTIAVLTTWWGGRPLEVAVGFGAGVALEAVLAARMLRSGVRGATRPTLRSDVDLRRYLGAAFVVSLLGAAVAAATSLLTGWGRPPQVALGIGLAHLASLLVVVPVFLRLPAQGAIAGRGERVLQWVVVAGATPLIFAAGDASTLVFLVVPLLAWGALRISPVEAIVQMFGVLTLATVLISDGRGPFASTPARYGLDVDTRGAVLSAFAITCALIVVPLMLRVGEYLSIGRRAAAERDLLQGIVDGATGVAIIGADAQGRVTLFNPGAELLLGYSAAEAMGQPTTFFHSREALAEMAGTLGVADRVSDVVRGLVRHGAAGTLVRLRRKDGVERTHAVTVTAMHDEKGALTGYVSTSEDVTEAVEQQRALEQALEVERQALLRLREVDAVKDSLVSTVSHELRTPITSIAGYLELLQDGSYGSMTPDQAAVVRRIEAGSERLLALVDDLLTLSHVDEEGERRLDTTFDLREAVREGFDALSPAWAPPRDLDVRLELPAAALTCGGDRDLVAQMVGNVLANAVKFTPDGGRVRVLLERAGGAARLVVEDSGLGVPDDEVDQVFVRFFRSRVAREREIRGSGLGLAVARDVVERHGGRIELRSVLGEGTTVEVRMPLSPGISKIQLPLESVT